MANKKNEPLQVSVNEAIEEATGVTTPPYAVPNQVEQPKRTRAKAGQLGLFVYLSQEHYDALVQSADGRPLNVWLSRLIAKHFDTLVPAGE